MGRIVAWIGSLGLVVALAGAALAPARAQDATPVTGAAPVLLETFVLGEVPLAEWQNAVLPEHPIADDRDMLLGGIGSDLWRGPTDADGEFWGLTDRGPNGSVEIDGQAYNTFPVPEFTPLILRLQAADGELTVLEAIPVVGQSGAPVTGLPNVEGQPVGLDFTGENELSYNPSGLDAEGLVRTSAGDFWLVDEYSPSLIHVDPTGTVVKRYVPEGHSLDGADYPVEDNLPGIYSSRRYNRGLEGLALSQDEQTLYLLLQSPLNNPDGDTGRASRVGRILAFDIETEQPVAEYVYEFEVGPEFDPAPGIDQGEMKLSAVVALSPSMLLVLERTDEVARLYTADLTGATDILGSEWNDPATSPSLEAVEELAAAGVTPLAKALAVDLDLVPEMPDKIEGVAVIDETTIAVINDNDFGINEFDDAGRHIGNDAESQLLLIETAPLPPAPAEAEMATPVS